jgi:MFS family permease
MALPAGTFAEFRRKRPILIGSDAVRFLGFTSLTLGALSDALTVPWLIAVLCINAVMQMTFGSASLAHTKDLLPAEQRADALGKLQSATWISLILSPIIAGFLVSEAPDSLILACIALGFLGSAFAISRIHKPESPPPRRHLNQRRSADVLEGVAFYVRNRTLRQLLVYWLLFAGAVAALTPVTQVFFLRDLHFSAADYGLVMGIPSIAALGGALVSSKVMRRFGMNRVIVLGTFVRLPFYFLYPLLPPGKIGVILAITAFSGILFFSSLVNTSLSALRIELVPDSLLARSSSTWLMATAIAGPVMIPLVGAVMSTVSPRAALVSVAIIVVVAAFALPLKDLRQPNLVRVD